MRPRAPIPNSETVKGNDVVQAVPTGPSLSDAEVATTPQGAGTSRREFAQAPAVVLAAADIAAAVVAAPGLAERVHLSRVLQRRREGWRRAVRRRNRGGERDAQLLRML